jgi:RNA 2',3'-cyclic 3'-phosphodiesterase
MRMFVAVVPPADIVEDLAAFLEPRQDSDPNLRWTDEFQWHLTLAFLAEVPGRKVDELLQRLQRAAARRTPFTLRITGTGAFPSPAHAKVVWLGTESEPSTELRRLATGARAAAGKAGVDVNGGRFRPHVTMARVRRPVDVTRWLRVFGAYQSRPWQLDEIQLIESHLGQGPHRKPRYEVVETFPLSGDEPAD